MSDIIATTEDGTFRVRVERDTEAMNSREIYGGLAHVLTIDTRLGHYDPVDEDGGPLAEAWERIAWRPDAIDVFTRWAQIYHGAVVVEHWQTNGPVSLWYMTGEEVENEDRQWEGTFDPHAWIKSEIEEWQTWYENEIYGWTLEERVVYSRVEPTGDPSKDWFWQYEVVDSVWGYYGYEAVTEAAWGILAQVAPGVPVVGTV